MYTICNDYIPLKECQEKHQVHVCRAASRSCKLHPSLLLAPTDPGFHVIGLSLSPAANGCSQVLIVWGAMGYRVRAVSCSLLACFS